MAYRLYSSRFDSNYWFVAIPKTGSQSIRKLIDENIKKEHVLYGAGNDWHSSIKEILRHEHYNIKRDNFFAVVRNPWAQAWSNFNYQKAVVDEKFRALEGGKQGILDYRKKHPMKVIGDADNKTFWKDFKVLHDEYYTTFDNYVNKMRSRLRYPLINSIDDLDTYIQEGESPNQIYERRQEGRDYIVTGMVQTEMLEFQRDKTNHLVTLPIEKPRLIAHFFNEWFPECNIQSLPHINVGTHANKNYTNFYTKKTKDIVYEMEFSLIERHRYKFGD